LKNPFDEFLNSMAQEKGIDAESIDRDNPDDVVSHHMVHPIVTEFLDRLSDQEHLPSHNMDPYEAQTCGCLTLDILNRYLINISGGQLNVDNTPAIVIQPQKIYDLMLSAVVLFLEIMPEVYDRLDPDHEPLFESIVKAAISNAIQVMEKDSGAKEVSAAVELLKTAEQIIGGE
jgi:hypothetical protein